MSKALFVCYKNKKVPSKIRQHVEMIQDAILPDNLIPNNMDIIIQDGTISCIINPVSLNQRKGNSICLGLAIEDYWWKTNIKKTVLEGSYAIFREDDKYIELQTDAVASRSIWYYADEEKIISSNSQLAIIYFLGDYEFNENVIPWMLSSGTLGPFLSWDSRIRLLKPQTTLTLNKDTWEINEDRRPITFIQNRDKNIRVDQYLSSISDKIDSSTKALPVNSKLLLPLSGGYDSRGILLSMLKNEHKVSTITWGSKEAIKEKDNDAFIAKQLADHYDLKHTYLYTENTQLNARSVIDRFIINSEGRTDNIAGYMDGFQIWSDIFKNDYSAIIRGEESFGWLPVYSEQNVKSLLGLNLISDFNKLKGLNYQHFFPNELKKNNTESIQEWRDRLYQSFRLPIVLAALNETKSAYVEIINPLLNYSILNSVRKLPNELRDNKKLFRLYVEKHTPEIEFATKGANIDSRIQLKKREVVEYFIKTIRDEKLNLIDSDFVKNLINGVSIQNELNFKQKITQKLKMLIPWHLKAYIKGSVKDLNHLDNNLLLFRVFIIYKMNQVINETLKEFEKSK